MQSVRRATKKSLANHGARFSFEGLRFHFTKLKQYTNPTGGALDKIPLNTRNRIIAHRAQFEVIPPRCSNPFAKSIGDQPVQKPKPIFLRKKAQYQVADHLLGTGQKAYWTGSTGNWSMLGLDIDDHESADQSEVQANSEQALCLFVELTGLNPFACKSTRGINAYLLARKDGLTTKATNETWNLIVRLVNNEAKRRGLAAKLECKGKAQLFDSENEYCGVQFKDPFSGLNPSDEELHGFWHHLETNKLTGGRLLSLATTLSSDLVQATKIDNNTVQASDDLLPVYRGNWAQQCRQWAIEGLPCDDSITQVVSELAKWLYFVELYDVDEVADLLIRFCLQKHNGYITRLNKGLGEDVMAQIRRIVYSVVSRMTEAGKKAFAELRAKEYTDKWQLAPLLEADACTSTDHCCLVPVRFLNVVQFAGKQEWLPKDEYWRKRASGWDYVPDETSLPEALEGAIRRYYQRKGLKMKKPTFNKLVRFLNHLWTNKGEARLGIESLRKMGFTNHGARQHIKRLEEMGVIDSSGYCPVAGLSKLYRLRQSALRMFDERLQCAN